MGDCGDIFNQAREAFLAGLPAKERAQFAQLGCSVTAHDVLATIRNIKTQFSSHQHVGPIINKITSFTTRIQPYFEVLGIIVSSHPESAAIAWGAFRLVLQVRNTAIASIGARPETLADVVV